MLLDTQRSHTFDYLLGSLSETVLWSLSRTALEDDDAQGCLRTLALAPWPFAQKPTEAVDHVRRARRAAFGLTTVRAEARLEGGRLLLYDPRCADPDSVAGPVSDGFFDAMETPPWDTWVAFIGEPGHEGYLVSYIPPPLIELCDVAVRESGALEWLDESAVGLWRWLRPRLE